ncbi:MAG: TolC family protein, partial [Chitinophagia bacterium]|nr:TolC family protein [Chitinophagia bacterium]
LKKCEFNANTTQVAVLNTERFGYEQQYDAARLTIPYDSVAKSANISFELATKRFDVGVMQTIEWLTNQNNLTRAKVDKVVAQYEYIFRMKVLEFYKGQGIKL